MWAGIVGSVVENGTAYEIAFSIHDSVYNTDYASATIACDIMQPEKLASDIEKHVITQLTGFSTEHICKFVGAGVATSLLNAVSPIVCYCHLRHTHNVTSSARTFAPVFGSTWI